uniref:NTF2 domain-containing protein n=1 Tax=Steinernema glaseri TaxID=37863 RepID=A0A1I7ZVY6_9BILA
MKRNPRAERQVRVRKKAPLSATQTLFSRPFGRERASRRDPSLQLLPYVAENFVFFSAVFEAFCSALVTRLQHPSCPCVLAPVRYISVKRMSNQEFVKQDEEVCEKAHEFIKLFHKMADQNRSRLNHLYCLNKATFVWNGTPIEGSDDIQAFWEKMPGTTHRISSLDAQKMGVPGMDAILVTTTGNVTYDGPSGVHCFTHSLVLEKEDECYKVRGAQYRFVD